MREIQEVKPKRQHLAICEGEDSLGYDPGWRARPPHGLGRSSPGWTHSIFGHLEGRIGKQWDVEV